MELEGKNYCVLTIDWNYDKEYVTISMPTCTPKYLKRFLHPAPQNTYYATKKWIVPEHGQSTQYTKGPENNRPIDKKTSKTYNPRFGHYCTTNEHFIQPCCLL